MQDDMESLCYTLLELLHGDLPWNLTRGRRFEGGDYFSQEQLSQMADQRQARWKELCRQGRIPVFLVSWHAYVQRLDMHSTLSYGFLKLLLGYAPPPMTERFKRSREAHAEEDSTHKRQKVNNYLAEE